MSWENSNASPGLEEKRRLRYHLDIKAIFIEMNQRAVICNQSISQIT